ncbi:MAG TPA: DPP IV N-terminal domain-containing protein [Ignavibacteriales bacterium]|nr:DPP IV N-terminal domain-containing protein [Ignavibacteriales bacterium]
MKKVLAVFFVIILQSALFPQNKLFTVEDVILKSPGALAPEKPAQIGWLNASDILYMENEGDNSVSVLNAASGEKSVLFDLNDLNGAAEKINLPAFKKLPKAAFVDENQYVFWDKTALTSYNYKTKSISNIYTLDSSAENIDFNDKKFASAFNVKNNLYIALKGNIIKAVSNDTNPDIKYGHSVYRNEFGIDRGTLWSPKGNYLTFYRMDESMVTDYPVLDVSTRPASVNNIKYPMAGDKSHETSFGIYSLGSGKTVWLKTGEPKDQYLISVSWSPDEKSIYAGHLNRDQNEFKMVKYNPATGAPIKTMFTEKSDKFVEPMHGPIFLKDETTIFLWLSRRDGRNHFYMYDENGALIWQLTKGNWDVISYDGIDNSGVKVYFTATKEGPLEKHTYTLDLNNREIKKLTSGQGSHKAEVSGKGSFVLDSYNSFTVPNRISILNKSGEVKHAVLESEDPLKDYKLGENRVYTVKNKEGIELYNRLILPTNFDSTKKYPVILYVYGGPHDQLVVNEWPTGKYEIWFQMMAQKGYMILQVDNRGTMYRGNDFEQATFRNLGTPELEDNIAGIEYLKTLPYVDGNRIGVYGWSYGGFMTTSLMTRTNLFKTGVSGGTVVDWKYYEVMYTERYMDTPQQNPEGYDKANLLNYVENLKGKKLLMVHGTSDPTVVFQLPLLYAEKAANLNVPLDFYPYIGHDHIIKGFDAVHLYEKITNYFLDNL